MAAFLAARLAPGRVLGKTVGISWEVPCSWCRSSNAESPGPRTPRTGSSRRGCGRKPDAERNDMNHDHSSQRRRGLSAEQKTWLLWFNVVCWSCLLPCLLLCYWVWRLVYVGPLAPAFSEAPHGLRFAVSLAALWSLPATVVAINRCSVRRSGVWEGALASAVIASASVFILVALVAEYGP